MIDNVLSLFQGFGIIVEGANALFVAVTGFILEVFYSWFPLVLFVVGPIEDFLGSW